MRNAVGGEYIRIETINEYHGWVSGDHRRPDWESESEKPQLFKCLLGLANQNKSDLRNKCIGAHSILQQMQSPPTYFALTCLVYTDTLIIQDGS